MICSRARPRHRNWKTFTLNNQRIPIGLSLSFAAGRRPTAWDLERLLASPEMAGAGACISRRRDDDEGCLELLASGLTYDLSGLAPAERSSVPEWKHRFGFSAQDHPPEWEAVSLTPGEHIEGGKATISVVRSMVGLAANLALQTAAESVAWHPAKTCMDPRYFARIVVNWLTGGAFPALGLTALERLSDGTVASSGLAYFVGQEIQVEAGSEEARDDTIRLAAGIVDYMVRNGRMAEPRKLEGPGGEALVAEPSRYGNLVLIWRDVIKEPGRSSSFLPSRQHRGPHADEGGDDQRNLSFLAGGDPL